MAEFSLTDGSLCTQCAKQLSGQWQDKFCSRACFQAHRGVVAAERWRRTCKWCDKEFVSRRPSAKGYRGEVNEGQFCSHACRGTYAGSGRSSAVWCGTCKDCADAFVRRGQRVHKRCPSCVLKQSARSCRRCEAPLPKSKQYCDTCRVRVRKEWRLANPDVRRAARRKRRLAGKDPRKYRHRAKRAGVLYEPVNPLDIFERDGWRCQVCGCKTPKAWRGTFRAQAPELDHRVPMALGGGHTWSNCQCACRRCNAAKADKRVVGQLPLFHTPSGGE